MSSEVAASNELDRFNLNVRAYLSISWTHQSVVCRHPRWGCAWASPTHSRLPLKSKDWKGKLIRIRVANKMCKVLVLQKCVLHDVENIEYKKCTWYSFSADSLCSMNMLTDLQWLFWCIQKHFFDTFETRQQSYRGKKIVNKHALLWQLNDLLFE